MAVKRSREGRRIGRPPAGAREGEKVKDYPQLSIRLPVDVKAKLQALSVITARPQWRIITDAIECYVRERPDSERRLVDEIVGRSRARATRNRQSETAPCARAGAAAIGR
jgi:predicted DNA-binding protein